VLFLKLLDSPIFHQKFLNHLQNTPISQPLHLHNLLQVQSDTRTCSSATVTLTRPSVSSRLKITDRSFIVTRLFFGKPNNVFNLSFILLKQINWTLSLPTSVSQFHPQRKTIYFPTIISSYVCLRLRCHSLTLSTWLPHSHHIFIFVGINHNHLASHALRPT